VLAEEAEGLAEDVDVGAGDAKRRALREAAARVRAQAKGACTFFGGGGECGKGWLFGSVCCCCCCCCVLTLRFLFVCVWVRRRRRRRCGAGGRFRAQALALLASLDGGGKQRKGGQQQAARASEEEALAAAMAALSLAAKEAETGDTKPSKQPKQKRQQQKHHVHRTLLERLGDLDGGREAEGFGIARVPPTGLAAVRAKPPLFDMAYNFFLDERLPDLAVKAGLPPSKARKQQEQQQGGGGGGGIFGWLRG
jgi:hypothetical protein